MTEVRFTPVAMRGGGATGLKFMDVGGGLGIDYDGSQTDFESSVNYTLQEYANDVVYHIRECVRRIERAASDDHHGERTPSPPITAR